MEVSGLVAVVGGDGEGVAIVADGEDGSGCWLDIAIEGTIVIV